MDWERRFGLSGRTVIVTGGASGIGRGCAEFLLGVGASVAVFDLDEAKGREFEAASKGRARFFRCDVADGASVRDAVEAVDLAYGGLYGFVHCAGVIRRKNAPDLEERDWDLVVDVSLKGAYLLAKYAMPRMAQAGGGSAVLIGSGWGVKGGPNAVSYCAAKGGVVNLTRALAIDHGAQNIRVNCVCPGDVDTPLLRDEARQLGYDLDKWLAESAERPIHRLGTPEDIAKAVYFFLSDLSPWASGSILVIDGGGTA